MEKGEERKGFYFRRCLHKIGNTIQRFISKLGRTCITLSDQQFELQSQYEKVRSLNEMLKNQINALKLRNDFETTKANHEEEEDKDTLISDVAHDLRAPLNRILGLARLIQSTQLSESQREITDLLIIENNESLRLVDQILHANSDKDDLAEPEKVHLGSFIKNHVEFSFKEQAIRKKIQLHTEFDGHLEITIDISSLRRIIENLISNAIKFSPANTNIFVNVYGTEEVVFISIRDQGPGISSEDQKKMYKRFQRLSAKATLGEPSIGLGLSIVKSLVERLNGEISVHSTLGNGTEFIVRLNKKNKSEDIEKFVRKEAFRSVGTKVLSDNKKVILRM